MASPSLSICSAAPAIRLKSPKLLRSCFPTTRALSPAPTSGSTAATPPWDPNVRTQRFRCLWNNKRRRNASQEGKMSSGKRVITIIGGGQSGLQLGNGLLSAGYDVRLVQDRKGDDIRNGKVMSSQCMFDKALSYERELGLNFWDKECPTVDSLGVAIAAPDGSRKKILEFNG